MRRALQRPASFHPRVLPGFLPAPLKFVRVCACEWLRAARVSPLEAGVRDMGGAQHLFFFFCAYMFIEMAGFAVCGRARACALIRCTLTQRETV